MPFSKSLLNPLSQFLEAASVAQKWRKMKPLESRLEKDMAKAFKAQGSAFLKGFGRLQGKFKESISDDDWVGIYDDVAKTTEQLFINPIQRAVQLSLAAAAEELIGELDVDYSFTLKNPRAIAYVEEHGAALVKGISETTRGYIRTVIRDGVDSGWSYNRIAEELTSRFSDFAVGRPQDHIESRAHLIAVTEVGNAYEEGNTIVINDLVDAGLVMEKSWSTVGDDKVSDGCKANEREGWIPVDEEHQSGDMHPLRFPGCRCTELYRRARGRK